MSFSCTYTGAYGASLASISTPNVSVGRSRFGFNFRPISPGVFWYFFDTSSQPRKTKKNMSQLVVSVSGLFSSHHFHLFYFAGFFFRLPSYPRTKKNPCRLLSIPIPLDIRSLQTRDRGGAISPPRILQQGARELRRQPRDRRRRPHRGGAI